MTPPHNVVRINGTSPGGEVWSINPRFVQSGGGSVTAYADLLTWATTVAGLNAGKVWDANMIPLLSAAAAISSIRVEAIGADGKLVQAAEYTLPSASAGTGVPTKPLQVSLVVSLLTGRPGRSFRGRLFLPAWGTPVLDSTMRVSAANRSTLATSMKTFLNAVADSAPSAGSMSLAVVSQTIDTFSFVTQLSIGDVLDTQRRRRDALTEQRTTIDYLV